MTDDNRDPAASLGSTLCVMLVFAATFAASASGSPLDRAIIRENEAYWAKIDARRAERLRLEESRRDAPVRIADTLERMERERNALRTEVDAIRAELRQLREELKSIRGRK